MNNSVMNTLNGYIPSNSQHPPLCTPMHPQLLPLSSNSQVSVIPPGIRTLAKSDPVFSTIQMPFKPTQSSTNNGIYNGIDPAAPLSNALSPALPTHHPTGLPFPALSPALTTVNLPVRDSTWLKLRVCPAFFKEVVSKESLPDSEKCQYTANTCPLAHPPPNVRIENNHVTVCFDFVKVTLI